MLHRYPSDFIYSKEFNLKEELTDIMIENFNITREFVDKLSYYKFYDKLCDTVKSRVFEGLPLNHNFTDDEFSLMDQMHLAVLVRPFTKYAQRLYLSKMFDKPLERMNQIVTGNSAEQDDN